ncbi:MAG: hypothetical protein V4467_05170 [Patescibacteria group bacterium]
MSQEMGKNFEPSPEALASIFKVGVEVNVARSNGDFQNGWRITWTDGNIFNVEKFRDPEKGVTKMVSLKKLAQWNTPGFNQRLYPPEEK